VLALLHDLIELHFQERPAFGCFFFAFAGAVLAAANSPVENIAGGKTARATVQA